MLKNENENSDQENEDMIFKWIDDIPIKKRVSFSNKNKIHFIETREEIGWNGLNMYMSKFHFKLIENEFKKEYNAFLLFNRGKKTKSRDEMAVKIYEFIEKRSSLEEFTLSKE
jgi:hypothetical protein